MSLEPDVATRISLIGTAERLQSQNVERTEAIAELKRIGRGRVDLLSDAAGYFVGADHWNSAYCHELLVAAGATDRERISAAAEEVRVNRARMGHTTAGTQSPR